MNSLLSSAEFGTQFLVEPVVAEVVVESAVVVVVAEANLNPVARIVDNLTYADHNHSSTDLVNTENRMKHQKHKCHACAFQILSFHLLD